jgi:DNA-binding NtrC family response regulator
LVPAGSSFRDPADDCSQLFRFETPKATRGLGAKTPLRLNGTIHWERLADAEREHIKKILAHTGGNKTQAARLLDIGLTTLYQKIKDYNL